MDDESIADQIVDGDSCGLCLTPFDEPPGHPCLCKSCYYDLPHKERADWALYPGGEA